MSAILEPVDGDRPIPIERAVTVVGRRRFVCDVYIDSDRVSRFHCLIIRMKGFYMVRDLGSANGTCVNGQRVVEAAVVNGDEISFHEHRFVIRILEDGPGSSVDDDRVTQGSWTADQKEWMRQWEAATQAEDDPADSATTRMSMEVDISRRGSEVDEPTIRSRRPSAESESNDSSCEVVS